MKSFLVRLAISALGLWVADAIVPGFRIVGWQNVILAALLLGIVNALVPIIILLTLPSRSSRWAHSWWW
jgi:putative membrane protein